ncbi:hypothetical protein BRC79_02660 [Halobacteriales archaeon QH_8_67_27]|nr:MAG: hypothetical protein BRC79_02660 [Halobacteriales archaeon QH_8_67_27]
MNWQSTPYTVPLVLAAIVAVASTFTVGRDRESPAETWATGVQASVLAWILVNLVVLSARTFDLKMAALTLVIPVTSALAVTVFGFTLYYTGRGTSLTTWRKAALLGFPLVSTAISVTNGYHGLVFADPHLETGGSFVQVTYEWGPGFLAIAAVSYLLMGSYCVLLAQKVRHSRNVYRAKTAVVLGSILVLSGATVASTLRISPTPHYTLLPLIYLFVGVVLVLATVSLRFVRLLPTQRVAGVLDGSDGDIVPLARDMVTEQIDDGIVVLDAEGHVVDANPTGKSILGVDRAIGRSVSDIVDADLIDEESDLYDIVQDERLLRELREEVWVAMPGGDRCYDLSVSSLDDGEGDIVGYVVLIYDITRQKRREQQLERRTEALQRETAKLQHQNERLDEFASIISHDLRNPLNVATGRLAHASQGLDGPDDTTVIDGEAVEAIERSHRRIERIVEDTLTLAREGKVITETEPVSLEDTASEAWANVETPEGTLVVETDETIEGDRGRLLTLFENLFRNAVEHSDADVVVCVESLEDRAGFAVADDGPGIPDDQKEDVFTYGFSTNDEGTGLGLSIVSDIVAAHGWQIEVTNTVDDSAASDDSQSGDGIQGTRFEITGVDTPVSSSRKSESGVHGGDEEHSGDLYGSKSSSSGPG